MGEAKMIEILSENPWGKRRLYVEPGASRELSLKRHSTLGEGSISQRGLWWVVERPRSYLWAGRWIAIVVLCEALFGELFRIFRAPHSMRRKSSKALRKASGGPQEPPGGFLRLFRFFSFFMKVQHRIVFCDGRGKILDNFIWDWVRKETALFRACAISWT